MAEVNFRLGSNQPSRPNRTSRFDNVRQFGFTVLRRGGFLNQGLTTMQHPNLDNKISQAASKISNAWHSDPRWYGIERSYTSEDVVRLRGSLLIEHTLARLGAERLWHSLNSEDYLNASGSTTGYQAAQMVQAGLKAIYCSSGQVTGNASFAGQTYTDPSLHSAATVPEMVRRINTALMREDEKRHAAGENDTYWFAPIVADAGAGFDGNLSAFEIMRTMIEAGAAGVHFEDQLSSTKNYVPCGGKVLVPTCEFTHRLLAARLAADTVGVPTILLARTAADSAPFITSDIDPVDRPFLTGQRTPEGLFLVKCGLEAAIARGLAYAPYVDLLWFETSEPSLHRARKFADKIHERFPAKVLAYNCSLSLSWESQFDRGSIERFQRELGAMGYKFQFFTPAEFHVLNESTLEVAKDCAKREMPAFEVRDEKREFELSLDRYAADKHPTFVGRGYFEGVQRVIGSGTVPTTISEGLSEFAKCFQN